MKLQFKLSLIKHKRRNKQIITRNITGTIIEDEGNYFVKCKLKDIENFENGIRVLPITEDSYSCLDKTNYWYKDPKTNKWIHFIRFEDESKVFNKPKCYLSFRPGYIAKGNIVDVNGKLHFRILDCIHSLEYETELD